jgi:hypothetical protein
MAGPGVGTGIHDPFTKLHINGKLTTMNTGRVIHKYPLLVKVLLVE